MAVLGECAAVVNFSLGVLRKGKLVQLDILNAVQKAFKKE